MSKDWLPSAPPSSEDWELRRRRFDSIWASCISHNGSTTNQHADSLKLELERCFCSGSWVACVVLSAAIVEVHLSYLGFWKKPEEQQHLLENLGIVEPWKELRTRRNNFVHGSMGDVIGNRLPSYEYKDKRIEYEKMAEEGIYVALQVVLNNEPKIS